MRDSPADEQAQFLHKGQSGKRYSIYASKEKQFHRDWWAVCQTCWPTSRRQPWTFVWRARLWPCLPPSPGADPACAAESSPHCGGYTHPPASESPRPGRRAGRLDPRTLWLALTSHQSCSKRAVNGGMWVTMNGDMWDEWGRERCQKHPNPQQLEHPQE